MAEQLPAILHVSTPSSWRGGEQQLAYLLGELRQRGLHQLVVCRKDSAMADFCEREGLPYRALAKRTGVDPFFARQIAQLARSHNMDLIHTHDSHAHSLSILATVFFGNICPIIVARRVDFPIKNTWFSRFKYNHAQVKKIVCVSDAIKAITARGLRNPAVLTTVHSGIDTSRFPRQHQTDGLLKELGLPNKTVLIGNVAALAPHKDYPTFLDTAAVLLKEDPSLRFVVLGDGPEREAVMRYHQTLGLGDAVRFLGFRKDVPELLPDLDVFLITSETEGLGTSILDAFACRVPVVATMAGGIPEIVINGETGLTAPVKDSAALASQVKKVLSDDGLRTKLVDGATQKLQAFTKEAVAEKTLAVYQGILD